MSPCLRTCLTPMALCFALLTPLYGASASTSATDSASLATPGAPDQLQMALDKTVASYVRADQPGAAVIVVKDGKVLLRKGYGLANVATKQAIQPQHVFRLGSITKQFTAVLILQLLDEGKLALNDPVTKFLPDYPATGKKVTIEHLLLHTSGIPSYTSMPDYRARMAVDSSVVAMIARFQDAPLVFEPGSAYEYNNSGYFLLGAIIEKVTGMSYADAVAKRIFIPLGMQDSAFEGHERSQQIRVVGYSADEGKFNPSAKLSMTQPYSAGSLCSSVDDLTKWDQAISTGKLLKSETWARAFRSGKLNNGKETQYGYAFALGELEGQPVIGHGGGINGFSTYAMRMPKSNLYIAVLTNADSGIAQAEMLATRLAATSIGKPIPEFNPIALDAKTLDNYVGVYRIDETKRRVIVREGDKLVMTRNNGPRTVLQAFAQTRFFKDRDSLLQVEFIPGSDGKAKELVISQQGRREVQARLNEALPEAPKAIAMSATEFAPLVGEYQLAPGFILSVRAEGQRFITRATGQGDIEIIPIAPDKFFVPAVNGYLKFDKGADGVVTQLVLTQNGRDRPGSKIK